MTRAAGGDRGSATLEAAILTPALLMLLGLVVVAGRVEVAGGAVEQAAAAAAREASLARTAPAAQAMASQAGRANLRDRGIRCTQVSVDVDTAEFAIPVGQPGQVRASVACTVALGDLAVPGLPGSRTLRATVTSPLDRYRSR